MVQVLEAALVDDLDRGNARLALGRAAPPRAAASLLRLDNDGIAHALALVATFTAALQ